MIYSSQLCTFSNHTQGGGEKYPMELRNPEIIFNLWYILQESGVITSLRAKAYICEGTEEDKLRLLTQNADIDYLIAKSFKIPKRFLMYTTMNGRRSEVPVLHQSALSIVGCPFPLFDQAVKSLEEDFPAETNLPVSDQSLVCLTPLLEDDKHNIRSSYSGRAGFESMQPTLW
jgi:hypothetical protein